MRVRDVEWKDFPDLTENYWSIYEELQENPSIGITVFSKKPTMPQQVEWFAHFYRDVLEGKRVASVAEVGGHAVGMAEVKAASPSGDMAHVGDLGLLIARGYRGKGIGTSLMAHVLEKCRGKFELIELSVFSDNEPAKRLYTKFGFEVCGHFERRIKRGQTYMGEDRMRLDMASYAPSAPTRRAAPTSGTPQEDRSGHTA
jgi:ribosomal protein S18 acetylase RimI-like enzyme